jgi:hypothetical protein
VGITVAAFLQKSDKRHSVIGHWVRGGLLVAFANPLQRIFS